MSERPRIVVVVGTRPDAIKLLPLVAHLRAAHGDAVETLVVSTGQHKEMLDQVFAVFGLAADHDMGLMRPGQTPTEVAARALTAFSSLLDEIRPAVVAVQGDTTTAFACGLAAFLHGSDIQVAHVEAGLRTGNKRSPFPEEMNRRLLGPVADLHFPPTATSEANLLADGIDPATVLVTGNTVIDALLDIAERDRLPDAALGLDGLEATDRKLILVTLHRRESFGEGHAHAFEALRRVATERPDEVEVVFPVHLNPNVRDAALDALSGLPNVRLLAPLPYDALVWVMKRSTVIVTDSGGIQEEAPSLRVPVLVVRENTERPEAVEAGASRLVGTETETILGALDELLPRGDAWERMRPGASPYGDGKACARIAAALVRAVGIDVAAPSAFAP